MLAHRIPSIMPPLTLEESLETTRIHSARGLLPAQTGLVTARPFRAPHHSISGAGLIGGGSIPRPGEVSLAHNGVLFLDELPEFPRQVLEVLRQPLEDQHVTIARSQITLSFPASLMLVGAMNPCKCGFAFTSDLNNECRCTPHQIRAYTSKISGPLLDRIDIQIDVPAVSYRQMSRERKRSPPRQSGNGSSKRGIDSYEGSARTAFIPMPGCVPITFGPTADGQESAIASLRTQSHAWEFLLAAGPGFLKSRERSRIWKAQTTLPHRTSPKRSATGGSTACRSQLPEDRTSRTRRARLVFVNCFSRNALPNSSPSASCFTKPPV